MKLVELGKGDFSVVLHKRNKWKLKHGNHNICVHCDKKCKNSNGKCIVINCKYTTEKPDTQEIFFIEKIMEKMICFSCQLQKPVR